MNLKKHPRAQMLLAQLSIDPDHRQLDEIGGRALERRVHRRALGEAAQVEVLAVNVGNGPHASEQRLYLLIAASLVQRAVDKLAHAAVLLEVSVDEALGFLGIDAKLLGQPERRQAVHDSEVDGLGSAAML